MVRTTGHQLAIHLHFTVLRKGSSAKSRTWYVVSGVKLIDRQKPSKQRSYLRQGQLYLHKRQVLLLTRNHLHQDLQGDREENRKYQYIVLALEPPRRGHRALGWMEATSWHRDSVAYTWCPGCMKELKRVESFANEK